MNSNLIAVAMKEWIIDDHQYTAISSNAKEMPLEMNEWVNNKCK